ncbi:MAG: DUF2207 domain-containing protein [Clostridia bacterium]|nr:DUF2207 domain-containing protein [Clostridia bacterium]
MFVLFCFLTAAVIAAGIVLVIIFHDRKPIETVEYYPPENITPLQFSSYLYGEARLKDVPVIILQWANEGFVKLKKQDERNFFVKKIKDLPYERSYGERQYFNTLFSEGDIFSSAFMKSQLGQKRDNELNSAARTFIKESKPDIQLARGVKVSKIIFIISLIIAVLLPCIYTMVYLEKADGAYTFAMILIPFVIVEGVCILAWALVSTDAERNKSKLIILLVTTVIFRCGILIPMTIACFNGSTGGGVLCTIAVAWYFSGTYFLKNLFKKRTEEGRKFYGRVLGFKRFVETAETSRIELLVKDNPNYYNEILPYCWVAAGSQGLAKSFAFLESAAPEHSDGYDLRDIITSLYYSSFYIDE